ncbi:hypothetical protein L596_018177 [Steinernema carpocapsae]|uniref:Uncharacterized protein n=1 Tax=Steinernema carpocapsae TaxID=34508 RepID=A0A4U5N3V9_STECR|nr:hypothetical protein L596_018177 [Steinernema carpocapsae]
MCGPEKRDLVQAGTCKQQPKIEAEIREIHETSKHVCFVQMRPIWEERNWAAEVVKGFLKMPKKETSKQQSRQNESLCFHPTKY